MRYTYDLMLHDIRIDTTNSFKYATEAFENGKCDSISALDNLTHNELRLKSDEDIIMWSEKMGRECAWLPKYKEGGIVPKDWNPLEETDGFHVKGQTVSVMPSGATMTLGELKLNPEIRSLADQVDPPHYQGYVTTEKESLQWLETMQYLPRYRDPNTFCGAVELQIRKYMDRNGGKDEELQEFSKALWYMKFLTAYMKNGYKPVRVANIESILNA